MILELIVSVLIVAVVSVLAYKGTHMLLMKVLRKIEDHLGLELSEDAVNEE